MYVAYATNIYKATYKVLSKNLIKVTFKKLAHVLKSVKRLQGAMPRIRLPITFDILEKICYRLRKGVSNNFVDCLIETTCTVAFFCFLRCGEFTVRNARRF